MSLYTGQYLVPSKRGSSHLKVLFQVWKPLSWSQNKVLPQMYILHICIFLVQNPFVPLWLDASLQKGCLCSRPEVNQLHSFTDSFSRWLSQLTLSLCEVWALRRRRQSCRILAVTRVCVYFCVMTVTDPWSDNPKFWCTCKHDPERFWGKISE